MAVGGNKPGAFPSTWTPGVRSPWRPVGAHRTWHIDRSGQSNRVDTRWVHPLPPRSQRHRYADPLPAAIPGPARTRPSCRVHGLGLAREILLALTGPGNYDRAAGDYDRAARHHDRAALARLRRVLVDELHEAHEQPLQLPEPRDDRLQAIAEIMYQQPADNTSLAELGKRIGASGRTLSRLFHNELGMTFYEWRTQLRIYHALVLLADGHDTTHVAHACGWANPSSFIAAFTSIIGTTPGRHRTSYQRGTTS